MSYLVLARKWRPQSFDDLVGQEHVSQTLANAIAADRVAHAFLFTGVRGVGKTTSARILAKALACEKGPTARPCLECAPCREIAAGSDVDVLEIDGASYTGVDDVRRLQESLPYRPQRDRFKIYIVDEVHMLSQNAWNAFLKTLEEPPPHVKFIFATTEVHKVPVTILSRCQRYDFKLIPTQLVAKRLRYVLDAEKIEADEPAVQIVAREAAGSMRDAMSLLDQAIAWGGTKLVGEEVGKVLGVPGHAAIAELSSALVGGDAAGCLAAVARLADQGLDLVHVAKSLLASLRDLVVAKVCAEPGDLLDLADEERARVAALASRTDADDLVRLHHGFSRAFDDVARSGQVRSALEMTLVRLARRPPLLPIDELGARLADLERRIAAGGGRSSPGGGASSGGPSRAAAAPAAAPTFSSARAFSGPLAESAAVDLAPKAAAPAPTTLRAVAPLSAAPQPSPAVALAAKPAASPEPSGVVDWAAWREVLGVVRADNAPLASVLEHAVPLEFGADRAVLGFEAGSFFARKAADASDLLIRVVRAHFGRPTAVELDLSAREKRGPSVAVLDDEDRRARLEAARKAVAAHPLVQTAIDALGAELRDVRLPPE